MGFALEKQLKSNLKGVGPKNKVRQIMRTSIGSKIMNKYRTQRLLKSILPYKFNKHDDAVTLAADIAKYRRQKYLTVAVKDSKLLQQFYKDDTVSKFCPGKKDVVRKDILKKQPRLLLDSLQNLYKRFVKDNCEIVSESTFKRVRPFWVTPPNSRDRETCACIIHTNKELLVTELKSARS